MSDLQRIVDALNIPKDILDRVERFSSVLFGPALTEAGEMLGDRIRFRRWRNQLQILLRAEELLQRAGISPRAVPLRTLVPLIEGASLEEDETIQDLWAALLANAVQDGAKIVLHSACIQILRNISPLEAQVMLRFYDVWRVRNEESRSRGERAYPAQKVVYRTKPLFEGLAINEDDIALVVHNLIRLGVVVEREKGIGLIALSPLGLRVILEVTQDRAETAG
jgi:hypothetical protein